MIKTNRLTCAAALLLSACSLAPSYERPASPVTEAWPKDSAYLSHDGEGAAVRPFDAAWQSFFVDPNLRRVIERALSENRDLRVAALNIEVARATYRVSWANMVPNVNAGISESAALTPKALSSTVPQRSVVSRQYSANVGVTAFELDLFGRLDSLKDEALESYFATEEARTSTQLSLVAEVANAYLTLLGDRQLLALTNHTVQSREKSLALIEQSFKHGAISELDLVQAQSLLESARTNQASYLRQVAQDKNALALLVGAPFSDDWIAPGATLDAVRLVKDVPVGMPSAVLLSRPDVMQAEHKLIAANANIGAARAAFFPTISLTGTEGLASPKLSTLFRGAAGAWSFAPQVTVPIFDGGRNIANLDSAEASRDIAVANYEKSIQSAFRDVADALAAKSTLTVQEKAQAALVKATSTSTRLSQARYDKGISSYLDVLDAERSLYSAQQGQITVQVERLSNLVTLYKALGGGRS